MVGSQLPPNIALVPVVKKSPWYRILRVLIVAFGSISLLATLLLFLLGFLGGGLAALVLAFVAEPYIEGGIVSSATLFLLYCFLYFLRWKKEGYAFGKIVLIIGILSILPTGAQLYGNIVIHNAYKASDKANPIVTGTQPYDFQKDVLFHTGKISSFGDIHIRGNTVLWPQLTKLSPPYPRNVSDLFTFVFDPAGSKGTVAQVTHFDKTATSEFFRIYKATYIVGGKIYWLEGDPTGGQDSIEEYDADSGTQKELLKGDVIFLEGGYGNYLMLSRPITKSNGYSGYEVSLYDISKKSELPLDEQSAVSVIFSDGYFCHVTKNNSIGIYNLNTKKESIIPTAATDLEYAISISGCSQSYIVYSFVRTSQSGTSSVPETHLLTVKNDGSTTDELMVMPYIDARSNKVVLIDNFLFFVDANTIYRKDLSTGDEIQILSNADGLGEWDTDGNYLAYELTSEQNTAYHLQKIIPSPTTESVKKITLGQKIIPISTSTKIAISGIKKTYTAGKEAILYTLTISPPGQYNVAETLVPEGNTPQKLGGNGSIYDSRIGGYGGAWSEMDKSAGVVPPSGASGIPDDIPPGSYHIRLDLLPLSLGHWNPSLPIPESAIATTNSSSFFIVNQ